IATEMVKKSGRVLILVSTIAGNKCNVVVASSNPKVNAGELASKLSKKLGGGGRGDAKLGVGGGKAEGAEEILEKLEI
ncbi:MAG: DHHA1 domain-containing protein, partial [Methanobacteriota archaeon]